MADTPGAGSFLTRKTVGGIPNWVLLAGGVVLVYVVVNRNKGSQSSSSQQSATAALQAENQALQQELAYSGYAGYSGAGYGGYGASGSSGSSGSSGGSGGSGGSPPPSSPAPAPPAAQNVYGYGTDLYGGSQYVDLGQVGNTYAQGKLGGDFYNVSGGVPVGFVYPGQSTVQYGVAAEKAAPIGTEVVTPYIYGGNVSKTATAQ